MPYAVGFQPTTTVWRPGEAPLPPAPRSGRGRPAKRLRRDEAHRPVSVTTPATELAADGWQQITWRDGSNTPLTSRFARPRVRPAHDDARRNEPADEEWLLIEWPDGETEPDHYWLSTLPSDISLERLVDLTKMRWRIERDDLNSSKKLGSAITKATDGAAFTTTQVSALRPTDSWSPKRRRFPLQDLPRLARVAICPSRRLPTQRVCRCVHNATCRTPSPRYVSASHARWFSSYHAAPAAAGRVSGRSSKMSDAVGLSDCGFEFVVARALSDAAAAGGSSPRASIAGVRHS